MIGKTLRLLGGGGAALFLLSACAGNPMTTERDVASMVVKTPLLYESFDKDKDQQIDRAEYVSRVTRAFDDADRNHDGRVDVRRETDEKTWFRGGDRDGDGQVTVREFILDAQRAFEQADTYRDGKLDRDEFRKAGF